MKPSIMRVLITTEPATDETLGHRCQRYFLPCVAGELRGERIAGTAASSRSVSAAREAGHHEGGVGDVLDDLGHGS